MSNPLNFDQLVKRKCLDLSFNGLHDANIDVLVAVIQKTTELHSLNLWGNRIALDDDKLTDAIAENSTIRVLSLGSNSIESEGGKRLAAAIKVNTSIVELHLGDNRIADEGAEHLADALASNGTIRILGAYGNGIGDKGAKSLAASFKSNKSLRGVWLHENRFGEEGSREIVEAVKKNYDIESIFLLNKYDSDIKAILEDPARKEKALEAAEAEAAATATAATAAAAASPCPRSGRCPSSSLRTRFAGGGVAGGVADGRAGSAAAVRRTAWTPWAKLPPTARRPCSAYMRGGAAADPGECVPTCLTSGGAGV